MHVRNSHAIKVPWLLTSAQMPNFISYGHMTEDIIKYWRHELVYFSNWSLCPSFVLLFHLLKKTDFSQSRDKQHPKMCLQTQIIANKMSSLLLHQLLQLRSTVITFGASYYIWRQLLLHMAPVITLEANYYICGLNNCWRTDRLTE